MTVPATTRRAGPLLGNGVTTSFPFSFRIFQGSDIRVVKTVGGVDTTLVLNSDYTVAVNVDQANNPGGAIIPAVVAATGVSFVIVGALPYDQSIDLPDGGAYRAEQVEDGLDKLAMQMQQIKEQADRALSYTEATGPGFGTLPDVAARANKFLAFDANGVVVMAAGTGADAGLRTDLAGGTGSSLVVHDGVTLANYFKNSVSHVVDTVAVMKTLDKTKYTRAVTLGYYAVGDKGNAFYRMDAADTTTADNGGSCIVAADGGRWKLISSDDVKVRQYGAKVDGTTNDRSALQTAINDGAVVMGDGTHLISSGLDLTVPSRLGGNGAKTILKAGAAFPAANILKVSPTVGLDPKGWLIEDFRVVSTGAALSVIFIDLLAAGKYVSKLTVRNVISDSVVTNFFVELLNSLPNADGLFTMVFEDCWSLNGYYLENVGDSVFVVRATTSGQGRGYYIDQLPGASHIVIQDGNCTSAGGILVAHAFNLDIDHMQCECPATYTGTGTGYITLQNGGGAKVTNSRITNNNINTQGTTNPTLACLYVNNSDGIAIDGNTLFTHGTTGAHIIITADSENIYVGENKYFDQSGIPITPIISDAGVGTMGVWKPAAETTWVTGGLDFYKARDGRVSLRGNLSGAASTAGQIITTLPVGFRPSTAQIVVAAYGAAIAAIAISTAGVVTLTVNGQTSVNFDGVTFSTK